MRVPLMLPGLVIVAIGRNEGDRLRRCLDSVQGLAQAVVYVDSGSVDGSLAMARGRGIEVVELDLRTPFTAARARNAGFRKALDILPAADLVQFVDGDCEVQTGWLTQAAAFLAEHPHAAAVCGQRRERFPDRSVYNRLCEMEWRMPAGTLKSCGGDVMMRVGALRGVGGYRDDLIAGEEPELCVRLRGAGWTIHGLEIDMTLHDAGMTRFSQWWKRVMRSGYAFAEGAHLHGKPPEYHRVWETRRAWLWGLALPLAIALFAALIGPWALAAFAVYPAQVLRLLLRGEGTLQERGLRAVFHTLGRFPEVVGQMQFVRNRLLRRQARLIEYK